MARGLWFRWGRHGAAGALFVCGTGGVDHYLLARRSGLVLQSGTWSLPGGALRRDEEPLAGALREVTEELGGVPAEYELCHTHVMRAGAWSYVSHLLRVPARFDPVRLNWESTEVRWLTGPQALALPLHPGLRTSWTELTNPE